MIGNRKIAALCISRIGDDVSHEIITSLGAIMAKMNCSLFVYNTPTDLFWGSPSEDGELSVFRLIDMNIIDVLIVFSERIKRVSAIAQLEHDAAEHGVPVISIGNTGGRCYDIEFDYEAGFETMVRHVLKTHKPQTVHFIAGIKDNDFSENRIDVFKNVISEYGFAFNDSMVSYGEFWSVPASNATEKLIEENRIPDAIICANDAMAIAVCNVLKKYGYRVPRDVIVTGFDGIIETEFSMPKITSCKCRYSDIASKCAEIIALLWEGKEAPRSSKIIPQIILSESCGCDSSETLNTSEYLSRVNDVFYRFRDETRIFAEMTARMQICRTITEAAQILNAPDMFYDFCCILRPECIDDSVDPRQTTEGDPFGEEMCLFYDSYFPDEPPKGFNKKDIIPGLEQQLELGYPIIFMALNSLDIPLGYVSFHFHNNDITNYIRISQTVSAMNNAIGGFRNIRYQQYLARQLEEFYKIDPLTGLYNRRGFSQEYQKLLSELGDNECLTVVLSDLDGLKPINDNYGHDEGDNAIRAVADALRCACPPDAIFVRFGGDEMLAVMRGLADENAIRMATDAYLEKHNSCSHKPYKVSSSLGVYVTNKDDSFDIEALIKKSDKLMYADKERKKRAAQ